MLLPPWEPLLPLLPCEPEPFWLLTVTFFWGAVVATMVAIIGNSIGEDVMSAALGAAQNSALVQESTASFVAPLVEETTKGNAAGEIAMAATLKSLLNLRANGDGILEGLARGR